MSQNTRNKQQKRMSKTCPADCAKRLQSARPLCLQRGAWACWDPRLDSFLFLTPLKVSPVAPRSPLFTASYPPLRWPFFQSLTELTNLARSVTFCAPISSQNDTQIWEKTLSKPVRKALAKNNTFLRVFGTPRHVIRSHRRSRITFFRLQRRTQKSLLFDPISVPKILSKPIRNPFKNTHKKGSC